MKPIYLLCLHGVRTGGPEAIHQLSDALITQGFDARLVYFTREQVARLEHSQPQEAYRFGLRENEIGEYAHYKVNVCDHVANVSDAIVVLPETLAHLAPHFSKATVAIWWLSVDNGLASIGKMNLNRLRRAGVIHAHQSAYAERVTRALGFQDDGLMLSDYTADLRPMSEPMPWDMRPKLALFNANFKVVVNLDEVFAEVARIDPTIVCEKLVNATREQTAGLLATTRAYVDLGSFPGKDRLPREALSMGAVPVVAGVGAGWEYERSIVLRDMSAKRVAEVVWDAVHLEMWPARDLIEAERETFFAEGKALFDGL